MKKLLKYILAVVALSVIILVAINFLIERGLVKQKEDVFGKLNEIFDGKTPYDVLLLGSSRTLVQINPEIIDSVLKINSFNAGLDGITIAECAMLLKTYLENHPAPNAVILNVDMFSLLVTDTMKLFDFPLYFPYLNDEIIKNTLKEYEPSSKQASFPAFLKPAFYDDFKKYMAVKSFINGNGENNNILHKGYAPKNIAWSGENILTRYKVSYSPKGIDLLKEILIYCRLNKIAAMVIYAPQSAELTSHIDGFKEYITMLDEVCEKEKAVFKDYSQISLTKNRKYFYNHLHLNNYGADIYSGLLANDLKYILAKD